MDRRTFFAIHPSGLIQTGSVELDKDAFPPMKWLQTLVGGYVEGCGHAFPKIQSIFVNEDGIPLGLPYNPVASTKFNHAFYGTVVIILEKEQMEG